MNEMSYWNHRIMVHTEEDGELSFKIHEVYYDDNDTPISYTEEPTTLEGDSLEFLKDCLKDCLEKSPLYYGEKFPQQYVPDNNSSTPLS